MIYYRLFKYYYRRLNCINIKEKINGQKIIWVKQSNQIAKYSEKNPLRMDEAMRNQNKSLEGVRIEFKCYQLCFTIIIQKMIQGQESCHFLSQELNGNSFFWRMDCHQERKFASPMITGTYLIEQVPLMMSKKGRAKGDKLPEGKPKKKKDSDGEIKNSNMKSGHWGLEENKKYHWFLEIYNSHFMNKHMRRMDKIFKTMALFIQTRQAEQCRSHHQKMEKKYNTFCKILLNLRRQHYGTEDAAPVESDILVNRFEIERTILTVQELKDQETNSSVVQSHNQVPIIRTLELQEQVHQENFEMMECANQTDPIANLFNDQKYENNLELHGLF